MKRDTLYQEPVEYVVKDVPLTVRRRTRWSECDPGMAVYAVNYFVYAMSAVDALMRKLESDARAESDGKGTLWTPVKAVSLEFVRSLGINEHCEMTVGIARIGQKTCKLRITGCTERREMSFHADLTLIFVDAANRQSVAIPQPWKDAMTAYIDQCNQE